MRHLSRAALPSAAVLLSLGCATAPATSAPSDGPTSSAAVQPHPSQRADRTGEQAPESRGPAAGPSFNPGGLPTLDIDTLATVATNDLVVRSRPEISDESVIHPTYLQDGEDLFVIDGPVEADGYAWYHVAPLGPERTEDVVPEDPLPAIGWVASGTAGDPWILPWTGPCPAADLQAIWRQRPLLLLACFGDEQLTLDGMRIRCDHVVPGSVRPSWLNTEFCEIVPADVPPDAFDLGLITFSYHGPPEDFVVSTDPVPVRVTGHFDDPAARTCEQVADVNPEPRPRDLVILACRARFVARDVLELSDEHPEP